MLISKRRVRVEAILRASFALIAFCIAAGTYAFAQVAPQITAAIDENKLVKLSGNTHPLANVKNDRGAVPSSLPMKRMLLVLKRSAAQDKALASAIEEMHRPGSKSFHQWMTPEQIGAKYGTAQEDVNKVSSWLTGAGFSVTSVSKARSVVEFSGTAQAVASAFHTEIHNYAWNGQTYTANSKDPQIPAALAPVVAGLASLNNFPTRALHTAEKLVKYDKKAKTWTVIGDASSKQVSGSGSQPKAKPNFTTPEANFDGNVYAVTPYDFATIYNVKPLWDAGIDGTGQQIAIVAETDINPNDIDQFRSAFGLPAKNLNIIYNGPNPGYQYDEDEGDIDAEWAGAVARNATIDFVVSGSTYPTPGTNLSALYIVENQIAPVMSESYGGCELFLGPSGNLFYYQLWQQAAAQGITAIVSTGDAGSAQCDQGNPFGAEEGVAVNGYASTPYNVAVGGTDFEVSATNPTKYWSSANDPKTQQSALSYIPEIPWNASCASPEVFSYFAAGSGFATPEAFCNDPNVSLQAEGGGGGASNCVSVNSTFNSGDQQPTACVAGYPKPDWQTGVNGIPQDNARDLPDVSLFASFSTFRSFYLFCQSDNGGLLNPTCDYTDPNTIYYLSGGGTSFASPAFAGIMALVNQKTSSSQGLANYVLYSLAKQQYGSSSSPNTSQTQSCNSSSDQAAGNSCTFYDVAVGTIAQPCYSGTPNCVVSVSGDQVGIQSGYGATPGYDPATGLGSVNAENLVNNWAAYSVGTTTTSLTASPASTTYGQAITLSGSVASASGTGTPTGGVVIQGMSQNLGSFQLNGGSFNQSISSFPAGSYNAEANYLGDGSFSGSTSSPVALTVNKASTTGTLTISSANLRSGEPIASSNNQIPYGTSIVGTLTVAGNTGAAGVLAPTGIVSFSSSGTSLGNPTLTGNSASAQTVAGHIADYAMTAAYQGDSNYNASSAVTVNYSVVQAPTVLEAHPSASTVPQGGTVTLSATVTSQSYAAPPTGTISFSINGASVGTVNMIPGSDPVTFAGMGTASLTVPASQVSAGANTVTATYSGDSNFLASNSTPSSFVSISGAQNSQVTLTTSGATTTNTTAVTLSAAVTINGVPATLGTVNFLDNGKLLSTVPVVGLNPGAGATAGTAKLVTMLPVGTHSIFALYNGVGSVLHPAPSSVATITVTGSQITTTYVSAVSDAGTPANYDVTATVIAGGYTPPTGTIALQEPSLNLPLKSITLDPTKASYGLSVESELPTGGLVESSIAADFNGDGIPDIATARDNNNYGTGVDPFAGKQLLIYLGKGDGTFQPGIGSLVSGDPTVSQPFGLAAGDFNADGIQDIAFGFTYGSNIFILLGNGDGTFHQSSPIPVPVPSGAYSNAIENLVVGDFNNDGIQDIAFANLEGGVFEVYFGNGDGSFKSQPSIIPDTVGYGSHMAAGDLNGDGNLDLVVSSQARDTVVVVLGNGDGTFQNEVAYQVGDTPQGVALGDLNGDGGLDIVAAITGGGSISVLLNNNDGTGTFGSAIQYPVLSSIQPNPYTYPQPQDVKLADMNNDHKLDAVVADTANNRIVILPGWGDGTFNNGVEDANLPISTLTGKFPQQIILADLNNDGTPDVITPEYGAATTGVLLNGMMEATTILNLAVDGAPTEQETLTAAYSGDSASQASTSPSLTLAGSGTQAATKLDWAPSATTGVFGTAIPAGVLNAQVENNIPGAITYAAQLAGGASAPVTSGTSLPTAGAYNVTATFTPTSTGEYAPSTTSIAFNVTKANVSETLSSSVAQAAQGAGVTLTDVLVSKTSGTPTGIVTFYTGTNSLGSAIIDNTGTAAITTSALPAGVSSITASYLGDANFNTDTAAAISVAVGTPTITFNSAQTSLTISAGSTGTDTLTVTPQLGYTGSVAFSCGNLPAGVSCSFSPASGTVSGAGLESTLTVTTTASSTTASTEVKSSRLVLIGGATGLACLLFLGLPGRRKRITWMAMLLVAGTTVLYTGCGGSSKSTPTGPATSTVALNSSAIKSASGSSVNLEAAISGTNASTASGTVTFYDGQTQIGQASVSAGAAQITVNTLSVGSHGITAKYSGDSLNEAATSNGIEQVITGQAAFTVIATSGSITQSSTVNLLLQ